MRPDDPVRSGYDTDVVVVGAGPIGLTLACALARHGVRFRLFERKPGQSGDSTGHVLNPRSQELLQAVGVRTAIAAQSYRPRQMLMVLDGNPLPQPRPLASDSPFDDGLLSHQGVIEAELVRALERRDASVERSRPLRALVQDEGGVTVEVGQTTVAPRSGCAAATLSGRTARGALSARRSDSISRPSACRTARSGKWTRA